MTWSYERLTVTLYRRGPPVAGLTTIPEPSMPLFPQALSSLGQRSSGLRETQKSLICGT